MKKCQLIWILGIALLLGSCVSSQVDQDFEAHINQLENDLTQLEAAHATQLEQIENLEGAAKNSQEEFAEKIALVESQRDSLSLEIQQLERIKQRLEDRVRSLESLLRDISFAASLVPRDTNETVLPASEGSEGSDPRHPEITPEMITQMNTILFDLPQYKTVQSVFPYQRENRSSREFIAGSSVFTEMDQETSTQYFYDSRANYSTQSSIFPEIRQVLDSRTSRPTSLAQFWIHIQAASDPSAGNLELQGIEFVHPREGRLLITEPDDFTLLQDATTKLDRMTFVLGHKNIRHLIETLTTQGSTAPPSFILIGKNQRIRISLQEVEVGAIIELLQAYRDLGGLMPE